MIHQVRAGRLIAAALLACQGIAVAAAAPPAAAAEERIISAAEIARALAPPTRGIGAPVARKVDLPTVTFEYDSDRLTLQARHQLDELAAALSFAVSADEPFEVGGHTDAKGTEAYNLDLSQRRAEAVRTYLVREHRLDPAMIRPRGVGKSEPDPRYPPLAAEQRRVVIQLLPPSG